LEYQGETHYFSSIIFGSTAERQRADLLKAEFAHRMGITLVSIPFWWDNSPASLAATIQSARPDITFEGISASLSIPSAMPSKYQRSFKYKPNSPRQLQKDIDPKGMYVTGLLLEVINLDVNTSMYLTIDDLTTIG
jgi:hypothetical protein